MDQPEYAKLSQRIYAIIIDMSLMILPIYLVMMAVWNVTYIISEKFSPEIYSEMQIAITSPPYFSPALVEIYAIQVIGAFMLLILYFTISEVRMNGQSIGKIIMNVKIVSENREKYTYKRAFVRNFLRILDFPFGFLLIAKTKKKQRPGDIFSKTIAIVDR